MRAGTEFALEEWDGSDFAHLVEEAKGFCRVGAHALPDPAAFLRELVGGLFGARADQAGGRFQLSPWVPEGWHSMALRRVRFHRTLVNVELRPRAEWTTVRLEVSFGPPIPLALTLRNTPPVARVTVDEVALARDLAIFTLSGEHEIVFFYGDSE